MIACALSGLLCACAVVGPSAVRSGRLAYNEAIIETDNQQMLMLAVRNRYGERASLLTVASVTANVTVTASASVQAGVGDSDSYAGNLVPLGASFLYEENPTISYVPVGGDHYARRLMAPVSLSFLAQLTRNLVDPAPIYYALVSRINEIRNPDFVSPATPPDPRFPRVVEILSTLANAHRLHWLQNPQRGDHLLIVIRNDTPDYADAVRELLTLLGIPHGDPGAERIELPVFLALGDGSAGGIGMETRSVFDLMEILSGVVEVPSRDLDVATRFPESGPVGKRLKVGFSATRPERASVAVQYREGWFYIDERDQSTKLFFRLLTTLLSVTIAEATDTAASTPVLTVPVSR